MVYSGRGASKYNSRLKPPFILPIYNSYSPEKSAPQKLDIKLLGCTLVLKARKGDYHFSVKLERP